MGGQKTVRERLEYSLSVFSSGSAREGNQQSSTGMLNLNAVVPISMMLNALVAQILQLFRKYRLIQIG